MRWTCRYRRTSDAGRGRRNRVVLTPRRWCQACEMITQATVAKKPGTPGRARISRKPLRRGCRSVFGCTCGLLVCVFAHLLHTRRAGATAPGIACALRFFKRATIGKTRANPAAGMQALVPDSLRGAKRRSNPDYLRGDSLDCFRLRQGFGGQVAEPVIGPRVRADPLARNDD